MGTLCENQLAKKLVGLFEKAADPDNIDAAVAQAKNRLIQKTKQAKRGERGDLKKLFNSQIATLRDRGCPEAIVEMLKNQRDSVLAKASKMTFEKGRIPFLPVIPRVYLNIYSQMAMVRIGSKAGFTYFDPAEIAGLVKTPSKPYYIFDVEDTEDAEKLIKKGRRRLVNVEVVSLGIHMGVLSHRFADAEGSRCPRDRVLGLGTFDVVPILCDGGTFCSDKSYGVASCEE